MLSPVTRGQKSLIRIAECRSPSLQAPFPDLGGSGDSTFMLISQKITSTSLTLNTMRELRSYSRMTHCSTGAVGFNMEGQVGSGEAQRREKLGFQPIESLNKQPGEISFLI